MFRTYFESLSTLKTSDCPVFSIVPLTYGTDGERKTLNRLLRARDRVLGQIREILATYIYTRAVGYDSVTFGGFRATRETSVLRRRGFFFFIITSANGFPCYGARWSDDVFRHPPPLSGVGSRPTAGTLFDALVSNFSPPPTR